MNPAEKLDKKHGRLNINDRACSLMWCTLRHVRNILAYRTRTRSARGSQNCAILSIICPFTGNGAFLTLLSIYPIERTPPKSFFAKLAQINTLSIQFWWSSYAWFENTKLNSSENSWKKHKEQSKQNSCPSNRRSPGNQCMGAKVCWHRRCHKIVEMVFWTGPLITNVG